MLRPKNRLDLFPANRPGEIFLAPGRRSFFYMYTLYFHIDILKKKARSCIDYPGSHFGTDWTLPVAGCMVGWLCGY